MEEQKLVSGKTAVSGHNIKSNNFKNNNCWERGHLPSKKVVKKAQDGHETAENSTKSDKAFVCKNEKDEEVVCEVLDVQ